MRNLPRNPKRPQKNAQYFKKNKNPKQLLEHLKLAKPNNAIQCAQTSDTTGTDLVRNLVKKQPNTRKRRRRQESEMRRRKIVESENAKELQQLRDIGGPETYLTIRAPLRRDTEIHYSKNG